MFSNAVLNKIVRVVFAKWVNFFDLLMFARIKRVVGHFKFNLPNQFHQKDKKVVYTRETKSTISYNS